jgi:phage-related protein
MKIQKFVYATSMPVLKPVQFRGDSLEMLREFPLPNKRDLGLQLDLVQHGEMPQDFKPMPEVGKGVIEIRTRDASGAYRVFYAAKFEPKNYVLHCFKKKPRKPRCPTSNWGGNVIKIL